jgi:hypothetical protein
MHTSILKVANEFAVVNVWVDDSANGLRLVLRDPKTGERIYLDALELESILRSKHRDLTPLVDPSRFD